MSTLALIIQLQVTQTLTGG